MERLTTPGREAPAESDLDGGVVSEPSRSEAVDASTPGASGVGRRHPVASKLLLWAACLTLLHGTPLPTPWGPPVDAYLTLETTQFRIDSQDDVARVRRGVIDFIWPHGLSFERLPDVVPIPPEELPESLRGLIGSDRAFARLEIILDYGFESVGYRIEPEVPGPVKALAILHQGHQGGWGDGLEELSRELLDRGMTVVAFQQPFIDWNRHDRLETPDGRIVIEKDGKGGHRELAAKTTGLAGGFLRFFVEPPIVAVNGWLADNPGSTRIAMVGMSGGGWTTDLVAAIDPRIRLSVSVGGSEPLALRGDRLSWGDIEQNLPEFYLERASWLELYVLGAAGRSRRQIHVVNEFDPCCFAGRDVLLWSDRVASTVAGLGGAWELILDDSHRGHQISTLTRAAVVARIERELLEIDSGS